MLERTWKGVAMAALLLPVAVSAHVNERSLVVSGDYDGETRRITISLADLDLRRDPAVQTAQTRIRHAAQRVCDKDSARKLHERRSYIRCYEPAMADATTDLHALVTSVRAS